jgi:RNA polymerase sigma-70 factor, ECF subfamily
VSVTGGGALDRGGGGTASACCTPAAPAEGSQAGDVALLGRYRGGDVAAFEGLFRRYRGRLRGTCSRYLSSDDELDDVVQETFLRLLRIADRVEEGFNVSAWLHRVAINICLDELRRRRSVELVDAEGTGPVLHLACRREEQPEEAWEIEEARRILTRVAGTLPQRQREAFVLREIQGLPYEAIARRLGMGVGAVETLLFRARERFRAEYFRLEGIEPTRCALVRHVVEVIGRQRVGVHRTRLVEDHLRACEACRRRLSRPEPPPDGDRPERAGAIPGRGSSGG